MTIRKYQLVHGKSPDGNWEIIYNKETENGIVAYSYPETFYNYTSALEIMNELEKLGDPSDLKFWTLAKGTKNDLPKPSF